MKNTFRNLVFLSAGLLFACTNPESAQPGLQAAAPDATAHFVSADEALARLESDLHAFVPQTRKSVGFAAVEPVGIRTRAEGGDPSGYIVHFEEGGYAILSADDRKPSVVAFGESGSLSAEQFEADFRMTADDVGEVPAPAVVNALIRHYLTTPAVGGAAPTRAGESAVVEEQTAFMKTKWTDAPPYNSFIPGKGIAGAPNIALSQILVHNHKYHGAGPDVMNVYNPMIPGGPYNPNWQLLDVAANYENVPGDSFNGVEAGKFVSAVGIANGSQFRLDQVNTPIGNVQTFMTDIWGYRLAQIKPFETTTMANLKRVMRTLLYTDKVPVYLYGDSREVIRHAWIADGWMVLNANGAESSYIHCNFCVGPKYDLWLLFESNAPFSVLFPVDGSDQTTDFNYNVSMIDYML